MAAMGLWHPPISVSPCNDCPGCSECSPRLSGRTFAVDLTDLPLVMIWREHSSFLYLILHIRWNFLFKTIRHCRFYLVIFRDHGTLLPNYQNTQLDSTCHISRATVLGSEIFYVLYICCRPLVLHIIRD